MTDTDLTHDNIGAAIEVRKRLGPGLLESMYEERLTHEFRLRNLRVDRQVPLPAVYKESKLESGYRLELLVEARIGVELKSVESLSPSHEAIILTYLRLSGHKIGLLMNFNVAILKDGVRRFIV